MLLSLFQLSSPAFYIARMRTRRHMHDTTRHTYTYRVRYVCPTRHDYAFEVSVLLYPLGIYRLFF